MATDAVRKAAEGVREAIEVEGPWPWGHQQTMKKHRKEWPTLWRRLDSLLEMLHEEEVRDGSAGR